jgi:hypothetical protein
MASGARAQEQLVRARRAELDFPPVRLRQDEERFQLQKALPAHCSQFPRDTKLHHFYFLKFMKS